MRILAGEFKGRTLPTLEAEGCRPAMAIVREAVFSMLEARGRPMPEARVLDVFAGTGSLGIEALSRGAAFACFLERNKTLVRSLADNCRSLGLDGRRFRVAAGDALKNLARPPQACFDVVFVDPPYGKDLLAPTLDLLASKGWLAEDAMVVAEVESRLTVTTWPAAFEPEADRTYGQTRILLWRHSKTTPPSTPEPSIP